MSVSMKWCVLFVCTWCVMPSGAADSWLSNVHQIGETLLSDMSEVLEMPNVTYSQPDINVTYVARVDFDMRAMGPLYNSTKMIIDAIANKQAYPEGMVVVSDGHVDVASARDNWRKLAAHYAGPGTFLLFAGLLAVALPLTGLFWCCCHWCRSGRRRRPFDRKYDACLKGFLAILLIALLTLFLFGVVCAFATETQLETGSAAAGGSARAALTDVRTFLQQAQRHARHLLVTNYAELEATLNRTIDSSGLRVLVQLNAFTRLNSVTRLHSIARQLDGVLLDLRLVSNYTDSLEDYANRLHDTLRDIRRQLVETVSNCTHAECTALDQKYKIQKLKSTINYSPMPSVRQLVRNVSALVESGGELGAELAAGPRVIADVQRDVRRAVERAMPQLRQAIREAGENLSKVADSITYYAGNASERVQEQTVHADRVQQLHAQYGRYRRYVGLGAASALLLMTLLMVVGLMCGVCGKRPDVYGASDCCNKGAGASCLLCGIVVMFVAGGCVALVLGGYFLVGVATQRFLCDPLTEPRGNRLFADLDTFVNLEWALFQEHTDPNFNLTAVLLRCHHNESIYQTLNLERVFPLDEVRAQVLAQLAAQTAQLRPQYPAQPARRVTVLRPRARDYLLRLADSGLSDFNFDAILNALESNVTSLPLDALAASLSNTTRRLAGRVGETDHTVLQLHNASLRLSRAHTDLVLPMHQLAAHVTTTTIRLRDGLQLNKTSLRDDINYLIEETTQAEEYLNTQGPELIQNLTTSFAASLSAHVDSYLQHAVLEAREHVGRCGPLSAAYNVTRDSVCTALLLPTNGYWIALSWCVLLLVPVVLVAQRLARLYRQLDPYPGPLVEAEYLYDAYADRDNIPLANAYKTEKRSGRGGGRGSARGGEAGRGAGGVAGSAGAAPVAEGGAGAAGDALHARRYNDMAPKHWEEGPPRYHGPTEYERPPPYYYPGPNDRQ